MATLVDLRMRDRSDHTDVVDLEELSPRARALAEAWSMHFAQRRGTVILRQSSGVRADLIRPQDRARYALIYDLDVPDTMVWDRWSAYPEDSTVPPVRYVEQQARRLPTGYAPVAADKDAPVPSADAALADDEWLTLNEVLHELRMAGRPIGKSTWRAYTSRHQAPEAGKRSPGQRWGIPQWRRRDIAAFIAGTWRDSDDGRDG